MILDILGMQDTKRQKFLLVLFLLRVGPCFFYLYKSSGSIFILLTIPAMVLSSTLVQNLLTCICTESTIQKHLIVLVFHMYFNELYHSSQD